MKISKRRITYEIKKRDISNRIETLLLTFSNCICYVIYFLIIVTMLQNLFDIRPTAVFAATGFFGVALGLGVQNLVRDIASGFFIIFENHYAVGENITIDKFKGEVLEVGIRCTKLKNEFGDVFIIQNGLISTVVNHSRFDKSIKFEIGILNNQDVNFALDTLKNSLSVTNEALGISETFEILGISRITPVDIGIQVLLKCKAGNESSAKHRIIKIIKEELDKNNIKIRRTTLDLPI